MSQYSVAQVRKSLSAAGVAFVSAATVGVGQSLINGRPLNSGSILAILGAALVAGAGAGVVVFRVPNEDVGTNSHRV